MTLRNAALAALGVPVLVLGLALPACDAPLPEAGFVGYDACSDDLRREAEFFETVMVPDFFDPYCSYCHQSDREGADRHGATVGLNYDVFDSATLRNAMTWARVASREMPPLAKTPSTAELELLVDWLNCTAPEPQFDLPELLADDCPDPALTFTEGGEVFAEHCTRCHDSALVGAAERSGAPDQANYDTAQGVRDIGVDWIWQRVRAGEMPLPLSADRVTGADAQLMYDWLSCGAPD